MALPGQSMQLSHNASPKFPAISLNAARPGTPHPIDAGPAPRCPIRSCSTTFCVDPSLWDYVIVHELLHLSVLYHSKLFKALMRAHLGDWERAAARLQDFAGSTPG